MNISAIFDEYMNGKKICVYGLGKIYKKYISSIIDCYSLRVDYYGDKNIEDKVVENKISKEKLLSMQEDILLIIMVGKKYEDEIVLDFKANENIKIIKLCQIQADRKYIEYFLSEQSFCVVNKESKKIAIYTYISNGYDNLKEPAVVDKNCDYYLISDNPPNDKSVYKWIEINSVVPKGIKDIIDQNRYCKMHGAEIFRNYRYSIYMDGSMQEVSKVSQWIEKISDIGLALYRHPSRNDIYTEGMVLCNLGKYDNKVIKCQLRKYIDEGMPISYGLFHCGIIVRDNKNKITNKIMHEWFYEYMMGEKRDQLSFTYVLWKNGYAYSDVGDLGNFEKDEVVKWMNHL